MKALELAQKLIDLVDERGEDVEVVIWDELQLSTYSVEKVEQTEEEIILFDY